MVRRHDHVDQCPSRRRQGTSAIIFPLGHSVKTPGALYTPNPWRGTIACVCVWKQNTLQGCVKIIQIQVNACEFDGEALIKSILISSCLEAGGGKT